MFGEMIILKDHQLHRLFTERAQLIQQVHEVARERNMLMLQLEEANRVSQNQSRKLDENMKDHHEISTALSNDLNEVKDLFSELRGTVQLYCLTLYDTGSTPLCID